MTIRNLEYLFRPRSIAVFGASDRAGSVGATVMRNLIAGGFAGPIYPVNLRHAEVAGRRAFRDVAMLPKTPDLAVVATPPSTVPGIINELGARGTRAAIVLTAGLGAVIDGQDKTPMVPRLMAGDASIPAGRVATADQLVVVDAAAAAEVAPS